MRIKCVKRKCGFPVQPISQARGECKFCRLISIEISGTLLRGLLRVRYMKGTEKQNSEKAV